MQTIKITLGSATFQLYPVAGAMLPTGKRIVGLFETIEDARSMDADYLAWGSVSYDSLPVEDRAVAEANSEQL